MPYNNFILHIFAVKSRAIMDNAVLIQGATLQDIEAMINRAIECRMAAFYESVRQRSSVRMSRKDAAQKLGVSLPTLDRYAKMGWLHAQHIGGRIFFDSAEVEAYKGRG